MEDVLTGLALQELIYNCEVTFEDRVISRKITSCIQKIDELKSCTVITHISSRIKHVCVYNSSCRSHFAINTKSKDVNFDDVWPEIELMLTFGVC